MANFHFKCLVCTVSDSIVNKFSVKGFTEPPPHSFLGFTLYLGFALKSQALCAPYSSFARILLHRLRGMSCSRGVLKSVIVCDGEGVKIM